MEERADELVGRCDACAALCCVALPFAASADFAIDKAAGAPCPNLAADHRCTIHGSLRDRGFGGCVAYDCFGAGQHVTQVHFGGRSWRTDPALAEDQHATFRRLRPIHELRWFAAEALAMRTTPPSTAASLRTVADDLAAACAPGAPARSLDDLRGALAPLLREASEAARRPDPGPDLGGADLFGADLRTRPLAAADLRGACLIGADLRGVDLRRTSFLAADLRGADLRGADLRGALFLAPAQLAGARTDARTRTGGGASPIGGGSG